MGKGYEEHNLVGRQFGNLIVRDCVRVCKNDRNRLAYTCVCIICGNTATILKENLISGRQKSCGCQKAKFNKTHGQQNTPTYTSWYNMLSRCRNPKSTGFNNYGGRGIKVCSRWESFQNFLADMGERPTNTTLDRIDNDKDYSKENCRWATRAMQSNNKRTCHYLTVKGVTKTIAQWATEYGVPKQTLRSRLNLGWEFSKAVTTKIKTRKN